MLSLPSMLINELSQAVLHQAQSPDLTKVRGLSKTAHEFIGKKLVSQANDFSITTVVPISGLSATPAGLDDNTEALSLTISFIIVNTRIAITDIPYIAVRSDIKSQSFLSKCFEIQQIMTDGASNKPYPIQFGDEVLMSGIILNMINENENAKDLVLKAPHSN